MSYTLKTIVARIYSKVGPFGTQVMRATTVLRVHLIYAEACSSLEPKALP